MIVPLIIALSQLGFSAIVTNNYKMLNVPEELAAILATKIGFVFIKSAGDNPIKATGALLLELTNLPNTLLDKHKHFLDLAYKARKPINGWGYMQTLALRRGITSDELYSQVRPSAYELGVPVLSDEADNDS